MLVRLILVLTDVLMLNKPFPNGQLTYMIKTLPALLAAKDDSDCEVYYTTIIRIFCEHYSLKGPGPFRCTHCSQIPCAEKARALVGIICKLVCNNILLQALRAELTYLGWMAQTQLELLTSSQSGIVQRPNGMWRRVWPRSFGYAHRFTILREYGFELDNQLEV